jgi:hypothetical protein
MSEQQAVTTSAPERVPEPITVYSQEGTDDESSIDISFFDIETSQLIRMIVTERYGSGGICDLTPDEADIVADALRAHAAATRKRGGE